jgi:hypothetical protein
MARRIVLPRKRGLHKKLGGYWKGERCEKIVRRRIKAMAAEREARAAAKGGRSRSRSTSKSSELRRLERALGRRKTLAARQRIQQRIDALRA